jgi:hypothetical protein
MNLQPWPFPTRSGRQGSDQVLELTELLMFCLNGTGVAGMQQGKEGGGMDLCAVCSFLLSRVWLPPW